MLTQIPISINQRLSNNSSNEEIFNATKIEYEDALKKSGFQPDFKFNLNQKKKPKNRNRKVIWFNPPFNKAVSTNVAKIFLRLIDKHFPKSHNLHKIFNRNTLKVSYSCMQNISKIYKGHNKAIMSTKVNDLGTSCNCISKVECPMDGSCKISNVVYKCNVTSSQPPKVYFGLAESEWKTRYYNHKKSFKHKRYSHETTLSTFVWHLKDTLNETPKLEWSVVRCATPYSNVSKKCHLCLYEKLVICTYSNQNELLNKRSELFCKCRHENKYLLSNFKVNDNR